MRTAVPTGKRKSDSFFVHGYQGAEEDADQLFLTGKLLHAVLAEAQVVCVGHFCALLLVT